MQGGICLGDEDTGHMTCNSGPSAPPPVYGISCTKHMLSQSMQTNKTKTTGTTYRREWGRMGTKESSCRRPFGLENIRVEGDHYCGDNQPPLAPARSAVQRYDQQTQGTQSRSMYISANQSATQSAAHASKRKKWIGYEVRSSCSEL